jgi:D-aspartate ligase
MTKTILVTNVTYDAGLSIVQELTQIGYRVIGADTRRLPFGLHSRYIHKMHRLPAADNPAFETSFLDLVEKVRPDAILPLGTSGVIAVCRQESTLRSLTGFNVPSLGAFMAAFDHAVCGRECARLNIPRPAIYSLDEADRLLANGKGTLTLVVKPRTDVGAARGVNYVRNIEALRTCVALCTAQYGGTIIQEYIPGEASAMRTVVVLFDKGSDLIAAFTMHKHRQWPTTGGVTAVSVSTADLHLVDQILPFFRKWRWRGAAEVELKYDSRDGRYKVIEINPRFPAYLRFPNICGLPLVRLAATLALGEKNATPVKFPSYTVGKKYLNPGLFLRTVWEDLHRAPNKTGALRRAVADLDGAGLAIAGMISDPLPILGRFLLDIGQLVRPQPQ